MPTVAGSQALSTGWMFPRRLPPVRGSAAPGPGGPGPWSLAVGTTADAMRWALQTPPPAFHLYPSAPPATPVPAVAPAPMLIPEPEPDTPAIRPGRRTLVGG
jgi:hypothetical protein